MFDRGWRTVVCVASGVSLTDEQCAIADQARQDGRCRIIVVNDNWRRIPDADCLYFCDNRWIRAISRQTGRTYIDEIREGFRGEVWTQDKEAARDFLLCHVESEQGAGLSARPGVIRRGGNSGGHAIALAYLFGARRILLIGYDCAGTHWFGSHADVSSGIEGNAGGGKLTDGDPKHGIPHLETLAVALKAKGVEVTNCTITTAVDFWPRATLEDALKEEAIA